MQVAGQLFGVTVEAADGKAPVWNPDVRFFCIKQDNKPKAYFFFVSFSPFIFISTAGLCLEFVGAVPLAMPFFFVRVLPFCLRHGSCHCFDLFNPAL